MSAEPQAYRGERIGLPAEGAGSLAPGGRRAGAFLVDSIAAGLIAAIFTQGGGGNTADHLPQLWSLIPFAADYIFGMLLFGRTLGMYLFGLRVIRVDRNEAVNPWRAVVRTGLLMLLVPALIWDRDGRGVHDRYTDTAVVTA